MLAGGTRQSNGGGCSGVLGGTFGVAGAEMAVSQGKRAESVQDPVHHDKIPPSRTVTPGLVTLQTLSIRNAQYVWSVYIRTCA